MSLRYRITLIISVLIVLFAVVTGNIVVDDTRRQIREEMEAGSKVTMQLLTTVIYSSQFVPAAEQANGVLLVFLRSLGRVRANEIRMYDHAGELIYTSPPPAYKAGRSAPEWFTRTVSPKLPEMQLAIRGGGRVVVTPDSSRSVLDAWDDMKGLLLIALIFLIVVSGVVFWLLGQALRPLRTVLGGLSEMEQGRLDTRLPRFSLPEFDAIGNTFNRMANALEESHAQNMRLALVAQQSSDAIMIHDLEGKISFWNESAERLFGYTSGEIVGQSATLLTPPDLVAEIAGNLSTVQSRRLVDNMETRRVTRDGRVLDVALSAAPLTDPVTDAVIGEICSMRDITEHKRARQAARELEQNRRLTQLIQTRLEEERRTIARELHDELGQCVTAIKTIGAAIANRMETSDPQTHTHANTIVKVASHIYDVVHGIIRQLRPSALDHLGLNDALEDVVKNWSNRHLEVDCDLHMDGDLAKLGEAINITVYRLVQEYLTNVVRHAEATKVDIDVRRETDQLLVVVSDNGKGLEGSETARFGLMGMRERVQALAGDFELQSRPGHGLKVIARIPLVMPEYPSDADAKVGA